MATPACAASASEVLGRYRPRQAQANPLYRLLQDNLEEYLARGDPDPTFHPALAEKAFRAFLECGIPRFGVVRFQCPSCGEDLFVAFSCKRRGACSSCDAKRAAITAAHAMDALLPPVGYRQWVFVLPKRLRYFVHRSPLLAGEASRILAREIDLYYRRRSIFPSPARRERGGVRASPSQIHFVQRSGSTLNLHVHVHAVVSDGVFRKVPGVLGAEKLEYVASGPPSGAELARLLESLRRKVLRRFARLGVIPRGVAEEMLAWRHSGFSLHAATAVAAEDRAALERLLHYCGRPAVSARRLSYKKEQALAVYQARDNRSGRNLRMVFPALDFIGRLARLIPPPRKNIVRYYGALGPNSPLRPLVVEAALVQSRTNPLVAIGRAVGAVVKAASAQARAWARILSRVFEVDPLICARCGGRLEPVAAILNDKSVTRLLTHLGLSTEFPKLAPARSPPELFSEECQADPREPLFADIDWTPPDDLPAGSVQSCDE
ncbi:MAG: transposase [Elusimicrobia bacterium]|nr:transposase [Elusimicrobiota bacterium]